MKQESSKKQLQKKVETSIQKIEQAKDDKKTVLSQTVYLGTVGIVFILPVILGAYVGVWLDDKLTGFSFSWTISFIFMGIIIGAINVYLLLKDNA